MDRRTKRLILFVALLIVIALSILGAVYAGRAKRFSGAYGRVQVGHTKSEVVHLFGDTPQEVTRCDERHARPRRNCAEIYWYFSLLERWEVLFNDEGKVIDKGHNVLF